jgi:signal transduction histidine kinase
MTGVSPQVTRQARRVALTATLVVGVLYLLVAVAVVVWVTVNLTSQVDARLERALAFEMAAGLAGDRTAPEFVVGFPRAELLPLPTGSGPIGFPFGRERVTWRVAADGTVTTEREELPLPEAEVDVHGPTTVETAGTRLRIAGAAMGGGRVIVGESMGPVDDAVTTVVLGLALIAPILLLAVFLGSLAVGRRVAMPIERARQRQLAFTADASHELRTPLSVIEANASLALEGERETAWYRDAFERVLDESRRMRALIEELLWLARFDALSSPADREPVDLGVLVEQAADRFAAVAEARALSLEVRLEAPGTTVPASPEWIDRLIGVLLDNACRYAPEGGQVLATVSRHDGRVTLAVEDSGPGIPEERRGQIFDRFHRETDELGGAGLGLAIADAVVRATAGRWQVGTSSLGGASVSISWSSHDPG